MVSLLCYCSTLDPCFTGGELYKHLGPTTLLLLYSLSDPVAVYQPSANLYSQLSSVTFKVITYHHKCHKHDIMTSQVRSGHVKSGKFRSRLVRLGHVRSSQVRTGQFRSF